METSISSRRIEWMRRILSQLFEDDLISKSGETQSTHKVGTENRRRKDGTSGSSTQTANKTLRRSASSSLVAMGNESFSWEHSSEADLCSYQMNNMETVTLQHPKSKSKGKGKQKQALSVSSSSSSWRVSCVLAFIGISLITFTLGATRNPFANPISQLRMKMQPSIEETDTSTTGTSSLPIDTLTMLFLRATGMSLLVHSTLALCLPLHLFQTSKVALLYGMAVLAAGQALFNNTIRIPSAGVALVFWFLAGWESWVTWETESSSSKPATKSKSSTRLDGSHTNAHNIYEKQLILQYLADDVTQTVLTITVPLLIATLGMPHTLIEFLLQQFSQQPMENDHDELSTTTLVLSIRLFGICQLAFVILMMDWKDRIQWWSSSSPSSSSPSQAAKPSLSPKSHGHHSSLPLLWLPLVHQILVNLPLFLSIVVTMEDVRLGICLVIAQVGVGIWMIIRTVGTLQYTQTC